MSSLPANGFNNPTNAAPQTAWHPEKAPGPEPATAPVRKEKRQQLLEELCAASIRALSGNSQLRYRGHRLEANGQRLPIRAPHLLTDVHDDDFVSFRGAADGLALRLLHSDPQLHARLMPTPALERTLFEILEQLRVETLIDDAHPGIRANLRHRFSHWCLNFHQSGLTENQVGLLLFCVLQTAWSRLTGYPTLEQTEGLIEPQRAVLAPHIGTDLLGLKRQRHDQARFAEHALAIGRELSSIIEAGRPADSDDEDPQQVERDASKLAEQTNFALLLEPDEAESGLERPGPGQRPRSLEALEAALDSYRVFDNSRDQIVNAKQRVRSEQRRQLRLQLDQRITEQGVNIPRLARQLSRVLAAPRLDGWQSGLESGRLDARRLNQLVTSPAERRLFKQEQQQPHCDTQVCFLIDNSGSMKAHIESIALLVDCLTRALDRIGARSEILGFTTGAWNGGSLYKRWQGIGAPAEPGRLNETCHIVYKEADHSWRRSRDQIAALLKANLFREGVDGEALQWAAGRLSAAGSQRKLLIVISDGCPMDSATCRHNPPGLLDRHLQQVAESIERRGEIELLALGVGLDLSGYYSRSLALDLTHSLDNALFDEVIERIAKPF